MGTSVIYLQHCSDDYLKGLAQAVGSLRAGSVLFLSVVFPALHCAYNPAGSQEERQDVCNASCTMC